MVVRLPARSRTTTRMRTGPSLTAAPLVVRPFQVMVEPVEALTDQRRRTVDPRRSETVPLAVSSLVHLMATASPRPSRLGESVAGAVTGTTGRRVSTTTSNERATRLPAAS